MQIKKFLGEKGPFSTSDRKSFTLSEKTGNDSSLESPRIESVQLVLGYGIHSFHYKSSSIYVRYKEPIPTSPNDRLEKLTLYAPPPNPTSEPNYNPLDLLRTFVNDALRFERTEDQDTTKIYTINENTLSWHKATERPKRY